MVVDDALGDLSRGAANPARRRQQLPQRDTPIEHASRRACDNADSWGAYVNAIAGVPHDTRVRIHVERNCGVRVSRRRRMQP